MADGSHLEKQLKNISTTIWPISTIYKSCDVFLCKDMHFVNRVVTISHLGGQIPQKAHFGTWIGLFKPKWQIKKLAYQKCFVDFYQIVHNNKDYRVFFLGGPNRRSTSPRYLEKSKNCDISATIWPISTIYTSYDVLLRKDVPFVDLFVTLSHLGGQIPQNRSILGVWKKPKW